MGWEYFFQQSEPSKYREERFGYPYPYPVPVGKQFGYPYPVANSLQYPAGYQTGKPDSDHLCCIHLYASRQTG